MHVQLILFPWMILRCLGAFTFSSIYLGKHSLFDSPCSRSYLNLKQTLSHLMHECPSKQFARPLVACNFSSVIVFLLAVAWNQHNATKGEFISDHWQKAWHICISNAFSNEMMGLRLHASSHQSIGLLTFFTDFVRIDFARTWSAIVVHVRSTMRLTCRLFALIACLAWTFVG